MPADKVDAALGQTLRADSLAKIAISPAIAFVGVNASYQQ